VSVEALLVRVTPARVDELRRSPDAFPAEVEELLSTPEPLATDRGVIATDRLLRLDEWSATLVAPGNLDPEHPLAQAIRFGNHPLAGVEIGYGEVLFNAPDDVERIAGELKALPPWAPFRATDWGVFEPDQWITDGDAGYPTDAEGVLRRAAELLELLEGFYRAAAAAGDGVIVAAV
jgi:hypothetical protein